jgi:hypothetical protein
VVLYLRASLAPSKNFVKSKEATAPPAECPVKMTCLAPWVFASCEMCWNTEGNKALALLRNPEWAQIESLLPFLKISISSSVC